MKLYAVSNAYMMTEIMSASIMRFKQTAHVRGIKWILVDNHWPLYEYPFAAQDISQLLGAELVDPGKNLGGHAGTTFGLKHLEFEDDDLILNYDLDSWPITSGWLKAMQEVMIEDKTLGWVALMPDRIRQNPGWNISKVAGHNIAFRDPTEMWNVTLFRGKMFREGMLADSNFYGWVETAMERKAKEIGLRHGWLYDFIEGWHPIPHPKMYCDYKDDHARAAVRFEGSFEEYVKLKGVTV